MKYFEKKANAWIASGVGASIGGFLNAVHEYQLAKEEGVPLDKRKWHAALGGLSGGTMGALTGAMFGIPADFLSGG